jgi:hypothetical protein
MRSISIANRPLIANIIWGFPFQPPVSISLPAIARYSKELSEQKKNKYFI